MLQKGSTQINKLNDAKEAFKVFVLTVKNCQVLSLLLYFVFKERNSGMPLSAANFSQQLLFSRRFKNFLLGTADLY